MEVVGRGSDYYRQPAVEFLQPVSPDMRLGEMHGEIQLDWNGQVGEQVLCGCDERESLRPLQLQTRRWGARQKHNQGWNTSSVGCQSNAWWRCLGIWNMCQHRELMFRPDTQIWGAPAQVEWLESWENLKSLKKRTQERNSPWLRMKPGELLHLYNWEPWQ